MPAPVRFHPRRAFVPLALAALLLVSPAPPRAAQDERPLRILVTNDDGIDSPGLAALVQELAKIGEVWVSAPDGDRSGASASLDGFGRPLALAEREIAGARRAAAVGGKPVDAAHFGLFALGGGSKFDVVVSGINHGSNVGDTAHYSGTVGAAVAAAGAGVPAVAVSQDQRIAGFERAARFTARFVVELARRGARPGVIYSINVPPAPADAPQTAVAARMGGELFGLAGYEERAAEGGTGATCRALLRREPRAPEGSDTRHYLAGRITVTPLAFDWTDEAALAELAGWDLAGE